MTNNPGTGGSINVPQGRTATQYASAASKPDDEPKAVKEEPKSADEKKLEGLRKELSDLDGKAGEKRAEVAALVEKIANTPPKVKSQAELDKEAAEQAEAERIKDIENARIRDAAKVAALNSRGVL